MKDGVKDGKGREKIVSLHAKQPELPVPVAQSDPEVLCILTLKYLNEILEEHFHEDTSEKSD